MSEEWVEITEQLAIPLDELEFRFVRSSGPGGQHVNRSSTQVELLWDVAGSPTLSEGQRQRLLRELGPRIDTRGTLHIVDSSSRSQFQNRQEALERFRSLLQHALRRRKVRRPTAPSRASVEQRLQRKRQLGHKKQVRRKADWDQ